MLKIPGRLPLGDSLLNLNCPFQIFRDTMVHENGALTLLNTLYLYYLRLTDSISKPIFPSAFIFKAFTHELLVWKNLALLVDKRWEMP